MKPDQTRVGALLIDTVSLLCRNGLNFTTDIKVQGLLGITIDGSDVFLVHFNETFTENKPTASTEAQPARSNAASETAAVKARVDDPDRQKLMAAKSTFRKTGFPLLAGPRHRHGALPLSVQARRRARQLGTSISLRMRANSRNVEVGSTECAKRPLIVTESDEKPDCSGYKSVKTETDMEQFMQNVPEEQDDVILVESEDGALDQDRLLPSDLDSSHAYLKTEERSEFTGDPMYSYDSYEQFEPSSSELVHGSGDPGTFSSYGSNCSDVKPMIQMLTCSETWSTPQLDWNCTQNSQTIASKYGHMSVGPPHDLNHEDTIEHMTMDAMSRFTVSMATGNSHNIRHRVTQPTNATSQALALRTGNSQQSFLPPQQQMPLHGWAANAGTVTSFVCKLCGATMGHRRSLLRHQINAHGRQKGKRGRPPIFSSL